MSGVYGRANMGRKKFAVRDIESKMFPADMSCHGSDYGSDVLTNLDSDIFNHLPPKLSPKRLIKLSLLLQEQEILLQERRKFYPNHEDQNIRKIPPLPRVQNILILPPTSSQY